VEKQSGELIFAICKKAPAEPCIRQPVAPVVSPATPWRGFSQAEPPVKKTKLPALPSGHP
ncbi:hypothetical protein, partial [Pseudomonas aeruginosa]|uniref:hypothetical protein n=1 Tax=Pseudomonas aeruginosa TaxID=287 RepID=UPI001A9FF659